MVTIIDAIINLIKNPIVQLNKEYVNARNRANSMGEALEEYVKDLFADTVSLNDPRKRLEKFEKVFSYSGNQNNPPDFIIKGGDAVEVKKIGGKNADLALNSSYPKNKLFANSYMITETCRNCEVWEEKDIIYSVGVIARDNKTLSSLTFVYGEDYAASNEVYEKIRLKIKEGIVSIPDVEFRETKELGRVNRVDPLGITYLRIRGMWGIQNPFKVFEYIYQRDFENQFNFMAIINKDKWNTFNRTEELKELVKNTKGAALYSDKIKDPNNPVQLKDVVVITFCN